MVILLQLYFQIHEDVLIVNQTCNLSNKVISFAYFLWSSWSQWLGCLGCHCGFKSFMTCPGCISFFQPSLKGQTLLCGKRASSTILSEISRKVWVLPKCESNYLTFRAKALWFFLSDEGPSLETLDNYSHISAVLKPLWLFHFDFHTAYAALHFYFMVLIYNFYIFLYFDVFSTFLLHYDWVIMQYIMTDFSLRYLFLYKLMVLCSNGR